MAYKFSTRFPYVKKGKCGDGGGSGMGCFGGADSPQSQSVQRVIIPQGLVNPNEITVIEIPQNLHNSPAVIARSSEIDQSFGNFFPVTCSTVRNSQLFPKHSNASASLGASQYSVTVSSPTRPAVQVRTAAAVSCPAVTRNPDVNSKSFPRTEHPKMPLMYEEGVTYGGMPCDFSPNQSGTFYKDYIQDYASVVGPHNESEETGYDYSDPERRARGFVPYVHGEALKRQFSQYKDFDPTGRSTPTGYQQSAESYLNAMDYSVEEPCDPSYLVPREPVCPAGQPSNQMARSGRSDGQQPGLKRVLDNLDVVELTRIRNDLKNFQLARRKLLFDASHLKH